MPAISEARWQEAQRYEAEYWDKEARNPDKLKADVRDGHNFTAGVLDIRPETLMEVRGAEVYWRSVLDIAAGPYPLPYPHWTEQADKARFVVLDPGDYPEMFASTRIRERAEGWRGGQFDEVWGYNVLQHVVDPAEVMATARACALTRIRWFDVVDTPIYPVHPHSISADWLRKELTKDGFRLTRDIDGSRLIEGHRQKWIALVASRST